MPINWLLSQIEKKIDYQPGLAKNAYHTLSYNFIEKIQKIFVMKIQKIENTKNFCFEIFMFQDF